MQNLALNARIPLSGLLAQYNKEGARLPGPENFDQILMKRATITGFFCPDFLDDGPKIETLLAENTMRADTLVNLDKEASEKVLKIMNFMDDLDDVQEVHTNAEFPDDFTVDE